MAVACAANTEISSFGIADDFLQAENGGWDEGVLGSILDVLAPVFKLDASVYLETVREGSQVSLKTESPTFMIFFFSASS